MKHRRIWDSGMALAVAFSAVACGGDGPTAPRAPTSPRPALLERFNDFRQTAATPGGTNTSNVDVPEDLEGLFFPVGETVDVEAGYIDGQLGPLTIDQDTEQHLGALEAFGDRSFLFLSAVAESEAGVGMFILHIDEGFDSPLFRDGALVGAPAVIDEETLADLTDSELEALFTSTSVMGCSGEDYSAIDWDQRATEFALRATADAADPDLLTIDIDATFVDPRSRQALHATGDMRVRRPD